MRRVALLTLLCGLLAGCSDSDADKPARAEYIEQADAICDDSRATTDPLTNRASAAIDRGDYVRGADLEEQSQEAARAGYDQLAALSKPEGDEEVLGQIEDLRNQVLVLDERLIDALRSEDVTRIESLLDELTSVAEERNGIETDYGFQVCGQD